MKKGPSPKKGFAFALPVALARGLVAFFTPSPWHFCDFMIRGIICLAIVRVRRSRHLHVPIGKIEEDFSRTIAELRLIPGGGPVSRELWLYSRYGGLRFFRVLDHGIEEIDRSGTPLTGGKPARPAEQPGDAVVSCGPVPAGTTPPGPARPGAPEDPTAKIIRYLKKRNAEKNLVRGEPDATVPAGIPGKPGRLRRGTKAHGAGPSGETVSPAGPPAEPVDKPAPAGDNLPPGIPDPSPGTDGAGELP